MKVPEIRNEQNDISKNMSKKNESDSFCSSLICNFTGNNSIAISVRFASIATEIKGGEFNASNYLALMPIFRNTSRIYIRTSK